MSQLELDREILDQAYGNRVSANFHSDARAGTAHFAGDVLTHEPTNVVQQVMLLSGLIVYWYSDRKDGLDGKSSAAMAQKLIDNDSELAGHPVVKYLADPKTIDDGGRRDNLADKEAVNEMVRGLIIRELDNQNYGMTILLGALLIANYKRDEVMSRVRQDLTELDTDARANVAGKVKTAMTAVGISTAAVTIHESKLHRLGVGMMAASIIPSTVALWQQRSKLKQVQKQSSSHQDHDLTARYPL